MAKYLVFGGYINGQNSPYFNASWWKIVTESELKELIEKKGFKFSKDKTYYEALEMEQDSFGNYNYTGEWLKYLEYDKELDEVIEHIYGGFIENYIKAYEGWG